MLSNQSGVLFCGKIIYFNGKNIDGHRKYLNIKYYSRNQYVVTYDGRDILYTLRIFIFYPLYTFEFPRGNKDMTLCVPNVSVTMILFILFRHAELQR